MKPAHPALVGVTLAAIAWGAAGCRFERGPNVAGVAGVWIGHSTSEVDEGTTGGFAAKLHAIAIGEEDFPFIVSTAATMGVGANSDGAAALFDVSGELGYAAAFDRGHNLFVRGGLAATVEVDPYTAYFAFEFPTATFGYAYHPWGDGIAEAMHFEIGAHGGVLDGSHARVDSLEMNRVGAAELGPIVDFKTGGFSGHATYLAILGGETVHLLQTSTCVGLGAVLCVDTRHLTLPDLGLGMRGYVGVSFGLGWVAGVFPR